jgi:glyoxylate carboligase
LQIKHYLARHEEGAAHAADGYYRASGRMAVVDIIVERETDASMGAGLDTIRGFA